MGGPWKARGFDPAAWHPPAPRTDDGRDAVGSPPVDDRLQRGISWQRPKEPRVVPGRLDGRVSSSRSGKGGQGRLGGHPVG